jgi:RNA-directed DNA polymerase
VQSMQARKAHSLIGQVYDPRNLARAWERVKEKKGAGGVDGVTVARFEKDRERYLGLLHQRLKDGSYRPRPVRRVEIDKPGSTAKRPLGIPTVMDRVCQQAVVQVLEPVFEPTFRDESFGFRPGRSTHMAMRRIWRQLQAGNNWVVDADIADFFGTLSHDVLVKLVAERVADGKVLRLLRQFLEAGVLRDGRFEPTLTGVPQGGVVSPLMSNIYLHVFDQKMAEAGYALTRYADDWVAVCRSRREAERALASAQAVLEGELGLRVHPDKTRIVHVVQGFEFLGYKIKRGTGMKFKAGGPGLYAYPRDRSIERFKNRVRQITNRRNPKTLEGLLDELNPVVRGWGTYFRRANVRRLFHRLNGWIVRRIWSWRYKRWRNAGWKRLPRQRLYGELGLVNLLQLIPSMEGYYRQKGYSR